MGSLTESMARLCGEIVGLRGTRLTFVQDLGQNVATLKAGFRQAHAEMAQQTKAERLDFVEALGQEVSNLLGGFHQAHKDMARKSKAKRMNAVSELKLCVGGMCQEFSLDLAGARRAWSGPSPTERRAKAEAERRAKAEAERQAREAAEHERQAAEAKAKQEASPPAGSHEAKEETGRHGKRKG